MAQSVLKTAQDADEALKKKAAHYGWSNVPEAGQEYDIDGHKVWRFVCTKEVDGRGVATPLLITDTNLIRRVGELEEISF